MAKYKDIQELTGLSMSTISRYFNDPDKLSDENVKLIEEALKKLDNNIITDEPIKKIGIFVQDIENMFTSEVVRELSKALLKKDYLPVIFYTQAKTGIEHKYYELAVRMEYQGLIFIGGSRILNEVDPTLPVILIDRDNMKNRRYPVVTSDNELGGEIAAKYLVDKHIKRCIVITDENNNHSAKRRVEGFTRYLTLHDVKYDLINYDEERIKELIKYGANSLFSYDDLHAIEAINLLKRLKIEVPRDFQVVGYDNILLGEKMYPSLTTISRESNSIASETVKILHEMIKSGEYINKYVKIKDYLIIRESTK